MNLPGEKGRLERVTASILFLAACGLVSLVWVRDQWPLTICQILIFGLCIVFVAKIGRGSGFIWDTPFLLLLSMPLWACLQLLAHTTVDRFQTWCRVLLYATYACAYFLALQVFKKTGIRNTFLKACTWFGLLLAIEAILQRFTTDGAIYWVIRSDLTTNAFGPFVNHDHFSTVMELLLAIPLALAIETPRQFVPYLLSAATIFAGIVMAASRAGFPIAVLELLAFFAIAFKRRTGSLKLLASALVILIFTAIVGWDFLIERYTKWSYDMRGFIYTGGLQMVRARPWAGYGLGTWWVAYPSHAIFDPGAMVDHAHCDWLEWAAEGGAPFLAIMIAMAATGLKRAANAGWLIGVAAVFLHSLLDFGLQEPAIFLFVMILSGASRALDYRTVTAGKRSPLNPHLTYGRGSTRSPRGRP